MPEPHIAIDEDRLLGDLFELVSIPSIGGSVDEVRIQEHLATAWRSEGLDVHEWHVDLDEPGGLGQDPDFPGMEVPRTEFHGVLATWSGTADGPALLIDGHTDVVPPGDPNAWTADPFVPQIIDGPTGPAVAGRGTCDMKGGLVAAWAAVTALRAAGVRLRGDVILAPVSGEEDGGVGTFALVRELDRLGIEPRACIIPEPTNLDIVPANGGALTFRIHVQGRAAHASRRTEGMSAIAAFIPIFVALSELEARRNASVDPLMRSWPIAYPISVGVVRAGDWASTVPDLLVAEGRYGVALGEQPPAARRELEEAIARACAADPWLAEHPAKVEWWGGQFASGSTRADDPLIGIIRAAHVAHVAHDAHPVQSARSARAPEVYGAPYGSDLRLLAPRMATVQYGPGDSSLAHSPAESVPIEQLTRCAETLARTMIAVCGVAEA